MRSFYRKIVVLGVSHLIFRKKNHGIKKAAKICRGNTTGPGSDISTGGHELFA
jgi:hypothetical protein